MNLLDILDLDLIDLDMDATDKDGVLKQLSSMLYKKGNIKDLLNHEESQSLQDLFLQCFLFHKLLLGIY